MTNFDNIDDWLAACKEAGITVFAHDNSPGELKAYSAAGVYPDDKDEVVMAVWISYIDPDEADFGLILAD